jgi:hypothetical protein
MKRSFTWRTSLDRGDSIRGASAVSDRNCNLMVEGLFVALGSVKRLGLRSSKRYWRNGCG